MPARARARLRSALRCGCTSPHAPLTAFMRLLLRAAFGCYTFSHTFRIPHLCRTLGFILCLRLPLHAARCHCTPRGFAATSLHCRTTRRAPHARIHSLTAHNTAFLCRRAHSCHARTHAPRRGVAHLRRRQGRRERGAKRKHVNQARGNDIKRAARLDGKHLLPRRNMLRPAFAAHQTTGAWA